MMFKIIKRFSFSIVAVVASIVLFIVNADLGKRAFSITVSGLLEMLLVIPPVFVLLGLLDVWVPRDVMVKLMGEGSGVRGIAIAILVGSAAAGPLYGAFPVAAVFLKKGASLRNVFIFIGAWSTTKIPMVLFELGNLGYRFTLTRLAVDIPGIIVIGTVLASLLSADEKRKLVDRITQFAG